MVVLDAYALIAFTKDEPSADAVADLLRYSTVMCSVNFAEVIDHLLRVARMEREWVDVHFAPIINQGLTLDAPLATSDPAIASVLRDIDHPLVDLPDSRGRLP